MEAGSAVYLTLEQPVGSGPLGEYILELLKRDRIVVIKPTPELVERLKYRGKEEPDEGQVGGA